MNNTLTLPLENTFEQNIELIAEKYNHSIKPGHGLFFDFSATPEYEKPVLEYLIAHFNWTLEKPFFIRKPL